MTAVTRDAFLGGALILEQPAVGHRAGTDAVLLAAGIAGTVSLAIDLGAGVGSAGLALARRLPEAQVVLVEREADVALLARRNIGANGLSGRVALVETDLTAPAGMLRAAGLAGASASHVLMNPPFLPAGTSRPSPSAYRRAAHVAAPDTDEAWTRTAAWLLAPHGVLVQIHRADALPRILAALARGFGDLRVIPVQPTTDRPAARVLVRAVRGSRAPLVLLPPLVLNEAGGFTAAAAALHRGEAALDWQLPKKNPRRQGTGGSQDRSAAPARPERDAPAQ